MTKNSLSAEDLMNHADRMQQIGESTTLIAHEIRNVLGGIKGFASLLTRDLAETPHLQQMARQIVKGTDHLNHLVMQILDYARPLQPQFEKVNIITILQSLKQEVLLETKSLNKQIQIHIESPSNEIFLTLDPTLIKSAFLNLLINAVQSILKEGVITIKIKKESENIVISVNDTGHGISEENMTKLFTPFFSTKPSGNGFGLVEIKKIIECHKGSIQVRSIIGQGTTFFIVLDSDLFI